jgi:hypothetical protein
MASGSFPIVSSSAAEVQPNPRIQLTSCQECQPPCVAVLPAHAVERKFVWVRIYAGAEARSVRQHHGG